MYDAYSSDATTCAGDQNCLSHSAKLRILGVDGIVDVATKRFGKLKRSCERVGVHYGAWNCVWSRMVVLIRKLMVVCNAS
jgi:hypothetical protein